MSTSGKSLKLPKRRKLSTLNSSFSQVFQCNILSRMASLHFFDFEREGWDADDCIIQTPGRCTITSDPVVVRTPIHLFEEKILIPKMAGIIHRPRLLRLLERTIASFPATAIVGRTGTGKTTLAVDFAVRNEKRSSTSWFTVGPTESDWESFATHLAASIAAKNGTHCLPQPAQLFPPIPMPDEIEGFVASIVNNEKRAAQLLVVDNLHYVYDAPWFCDFLGIFVASLPPNWRLLLLSRSKPPGPIWRMRSKQMLGVIDERRLLLSFSEVETIRRLRGIKKRKDEAQNLGNDQIVRISDLTADL